MGSTDRLKRAVIKEELVALTGDFVKAVILQQFIFWSERVEDFDQFILEERQRARDAGEDVVIDLTKGWIYKKADELSEETMLGLSKSNIMNHIKKLVENGWLDQRRNPKNRMDKTYQYRVNISRIQKALLSLGYSLEGYRVPLNFIVELAESRSSETELRSSDSQFRSSASLLSSHETAPTSSNSQLGGSDLLTRSSDTKQQYQRSQSQITSEITYTQTGSFQTPADTQQPLDVCDELKRTFGLQVSHNTLQTWRSYTDDDTIFQVCNMAAHHSDIKNIIGYVSAVIKNGYTAPSNRLTPQKSDPRYEEFYKLFPDT